MGGSHSIRRDRCSPLSTQPDVAIAAAAGAGLRRYVTSLQLSNNSATAREIYAKNGHRPQLLEHLAELFPRHIQIHYGRYRREELFEAARRSRACAYLADEDHGPVSAQWVMGQKTPHIKNGRYLAERGPIVYRPGGGSS